jgi:transposase-like protein
MLKATGSCPGRPRKSKGAKNNMWTDELREQVIKQYTDANPTADNSMEIVKEIAEEIGATPNGVRMVLSKAEVYVKKADSGKKATGDKPAAKTTRVSKEDAQNALTEAIEGLGATADAEIISKMTGKAAVYFTSVLQSLSK